MGHTVEFIMIVDFGKKALNCQYVQNKRKLPILNIFTWSQPSIIFFLSFTVDWSIIKMYSFLASLYIEFYRTIRIASTAVFKSLVEFLTLKPIFLGFLNKKPIEKIMLSISLFFLFDKH